MRQPLVLIAASGLAREVAVAVEEDGPYEVVGVLDDNVDLRGTLCAGAVVTGPVDTASDMGDVKFLICAGSGLARRSIADRLARLGIDDDRFATVIHPDASIGSSCRIGRGTIVLGQVAMTAHVDVAKHVVLMPHVVLTHDDRIAGYATLCAGVVLGGNVSVGEAAYLGMNSAVRQGVRVGAAATLGMGSVLLCDQPDGQTWIGVPASRLIPVGGTTTAAAKNGADRHPASPTTGRHDL